MTDKTPEDIIFNKMLSGYEQRLFEEDHVQLSKSEKLAIRCFFDFIEGVGYLRPSEPCAGEFAEAYYLIRDALVIADQLAEADLTAWQIGEEREFLPRARKRVRDVKEAFLHLEELHRAAQNQKMPERVTVGELANILAQQGWYPHQDQLTTLKNIFPHGLVVVEEK